MSQILLKKPLTEVLQLERNGLLIKLVKPDHEIEWLLQMLHILLFIVCQRRSLYNNPVYDFTIKSTIIMSEDYTFLGVKNEINNFKRQYFTWPWRLYTSFSN